MILQNPAANHTNILSHKTTEEPPVKPVYVFTMPENQHIAHMKQLAAIGFVSSLATHLHG
jgi:hypothetical protein